MSVSKFKLKPVVAVLASVFMSGAFAQTVDVVQTENVSVFGHGQTRQIQSITQKDMEQAVAGTSPLKVLEKLPGVSFQSSDPFGAYEWSTRFSVRGFAQNYMGFTLDGIPLGDMSYGNNNGLHISRAISSENVGRAELSQGAGGLGVASTSNLGGAVQFSSVDPENKAGGSVNQTFGSNNTSRTYARIDTGMLASGTKAYVSFTNQYSQKWKGAGEQKAKQFNSKIVHIWDENRISAFLNTSDRTEVDYQDVSKEMVSKLGWNWDNYYPNFNQAVDAARGIFTPGVNSIVGSPATGKVDVAYYQGSGLRKDTLSGATVDLKVNDEMRVKATLYHHQNDGQGHWYTPYTASPGAAAAAGVYAGAGLPLSLRTTEYGIKRTGLVSDLTWNTGIHKFNAGLWYEKSDSTAARNFYAVTSGADMNVFLTQPFFTQWMQKFTTTTTQIHVQDTMSLMDNKMTLNVGFKSPKVKIDAVSVVGTNASGTLTAKKSFLPQIGVNYAFDDMNEVYADASQNMRAYQPGVGGQFSQTQVAFDATAGTMKPETSDTFEAGYRYKGDDLQGSVTAYFTNFHDRMLAVASSAGIVGAPTVFANVGGVQSKGIEAAISWAPVKHWNWFNSLTLNNSTYQSSYLNGATLINTAGKTVLNSPKVMFDTSVGYEQEGWFGNIGGKYTGKRFYTYTNDNSVDPYWLMNAAAGYKQKHTFGLEEFSAQINVSNLLDKKYFGTIDSNGVPASDLTGGTNTLQVGAPRQVFVTVTGKF